MLTQENTNGFTDEQLAEMNARVKFLMGNYDPEYGDKGEYEKWAETETLKKFGGA